MSEGHTGLHPVEDHPIALFPGLRLRSERVFVERLDQTGREHRGPRHDLRKQALLLLVVAEVVHRKGSADQHGDHGRWRHAAPHLFDQQAQALVTERHAPVCFTDRHAEQARFGEIRPELGIEALVPRFDLAQVFVAGLVAEDLPREVAQFDLFVAE